MELAADLLGPPLPSAASREIGGCHLPLGGGTSVGADQRDRTHVPWSGGVSLISHGACVRRAMTASPAGGSTGRAADSRPYGKRRRVPRRGTLVVARGFAWALGAEASGDASLRRGRRLDADSPGLGACGGVAAPGCRGRQPLQRDGAMRMDHIGRVTGLEDPSTRPWTHSGGNAVELAADLLGPPFRQPPRGRSAAATSPVGGGKSVGTDQRSFIFQHSLFMEQRTPLGALRGEFVVLAVSPCPEPFLFRSAARRSSAWRGDRRSAAAGRPAGTAPPGS